MTSLRTHKAFRSVERRKPRVPLARLGVTGALLLFVVACGARPAVTRPAPAQVSSAPAPTPQVGYPAEPKAAAPVPLPPGAGAAIPLQKYIVVDQFGYRPELKKVAILVDPEAGWNGPDGYTPGPQLEVRKWKDSTIAYVDRADVWGGGATDDTAGDRGAWFDFSALTDAGLYYVFDPTHQVRSHPFEIGRDVYHRPLRTAFRAFYYNRANFAKAPPYSCVGSRCWSLGADNVGEHQDRAARSVRDREDPSRARDLSGGWWDGGSTSKSLTSSNDAFHQLLTAYEERPQAFTDDFGIPETGNGIPDVLDEVLVELDWLKRMQPADLNGGALLKVGGAAAATTVPDESRLPRFYYPSPCSSATVVLAGELAHAAVVFRNVPRLASAVPELQKRARDAWSFYLTKPRSDACDDGTITSGDADQALPEQDSSAVTAAIYLFALTGERQYDDYVRDNYATTGPFQGDTWSVKRPSDGDALLFYATLSNGDRRTQNAILERKRAAAMNAKTYRFRPGLNLYRAYMPDAAYGRGSNQARAALGNANLAVVAHALVHPTENADYEERAAGLLHSFHGVNAMQLVYLSNMYADGAEVSADEVYHAWFRDKHPRWDNARLSELGPAPGYVTGGPNKQYCGGLDPRQHACARSRVREQPAEKAYLDVNTGDEPSNPFDKSWELTEPALTIQASYVRLLSKFAD